MSVQTSHHLTTVWDASPTAARIGRIPHGPEGSAERIAEALLALEVGDPSTFDLIARAEHTLGAATHRPVVRMAIDGFAWFMTASDARDLAAALRADPRSLLPGPARRSLRALADLVPRAFEAAADEADACAAARNAAPALEAVQ